jgi:lysophospholipase L1-like esterase
MDEPAPVRTRAARIRRKLGVMLLSFLAACVLGEVVMRALDLGPPPQPKERGKLYQKSANPILNYEPKPGGELVQTIQRSRGAEAVEIKSTFNEHGVRGAVYPKKKGEQVYRIACVGDSFTFGMGVAEEGTWPAQLQRSLDHFEPERDIEVWNFGIAGYDGLQEYEDLRTRVMTFEPDLILIAYYINDAVTSGTEISKSSYLNRRLRVLLNPNAGNWISTLRNYSVLADSIADTIFRKVGMTEYTRRYTEVYEENSEGWQELQESLIEVRDVAHMKHARLAMVLYPQLVPLGDGLASDRALAVVDAFCRENGIRTFDLQPTFLGKPLQSLWVHPYDQHPTAQGHQMAGIAIAQYVIDAGFLEE